MPASKPAESFIYDIAIIGGGIAGASIAREASRQGLKVILFEKNTFGSGTSSKSSKLIHGGLRYLETAWSALLRGNAIEFWKNFRFVFLALRETHALAREWPNLIHEIELLMPIYQNQGRSKNAVFFGTWLYGFLSRLAGGKHSTRCLKNAQEVLKREPGLDAKGLLGAALVWDHTTDDLALVQALINQARQLGAQTHERIPVLRYHRDRQTKIFDIETPEGFYYSKQLINASGAWVDQMRAQGTGQKSEMIVPVAGAHIEVKPFCNYSSILQAGDGRIFFIINRCGTARIGTTERLETNPDHVAASNEEVLYLLKGVKEFFPKFDTQPETILRADAGIRPLAKPAKATSMSKISREHQFVADEMGCMHILGVKLTDHRRAASELLKRLQSNPRHIGLQEKS